MAKVSVVIPVYNVEKYIETCVRSLFEQTLHDVEYVFVDDCSPDRSVEILKGLVGEYQTRLEEEGKVVRILRMPVNSGQAKVRREGVAHCTGEYIIHCDSDDWVETDMYRAMYETAVASGSDVVVCDYRMTCTTSDVELVDSDKAGGTIVWQSPASGETVPEWTTIKFRVSAGLASSALPITVDIPQNGKDIVKVEIYVGDEPNPQYSETVYEADGAVSTTLYGTGRKMVKVYFDGVLDQKQSYERSFG